MPRSIYQHGHLLMADTIRLIGPTQRAYAHTLIDAAPDGHVVKLGAETRRDAQNRKLHACIADIRRHVPEMRAFSADQVRMRFLDALGEEMAYLPKLSGEGFFPCGLRSSTLTVAQFAGLINLIEEYGARHGVAWSEGPDNAT